MVYPTLFLVSPGVFHAPRARESTINGVLMKKGKTHLYIPDPHATVYHNHSRFRAIGNFIIRHKPDVIICAGDLADMPSLCSYDRGKRQFEGRRYIEDVRAVIAAQKELFAPMIAFNERARERKKKTYNPRLILTLGNHEGRILRVGELSPELSGICNISDLQYEEFGWEVHPEGVPIEVDGIFYSHYFTSGPMCRPISGEHGAYQLLKKRHRSCTAGHMHYLKYATETLPGGRRVHGLIAGCALDTDQHETYAGESNKEWWRGIVMKHNVVDGDYDIELISMKHLKDRYL